MDLIITRYGKSDKQTIGSGYVVNTEGFIDYEFCTLELPWLNNKRKISCIPVGEYKVKKRWSKRFKNHFHIQDVDSRKWILIHKGNYHTDILGCILVGDDLGYINSDEEIDVKNSKDTMDILLSKLPNEFTLKIN